MNKWAAFLLAVIVLVLDKHIMAWISLKKAKSAEKTAEHERERAEAEERRAGLNKLEAEAKQITAQLQKQTVERIADMSAEQAEAYKCAVAQNCESCRVQHLMSLQSITQHATQQAIPWRFW